MLFVLACLVFFYPEVLGYNSYMARIVITTILYVALYAGTYAYNNNMVRSAGYSYNVSYCLVSSETIRAVIYHIIHHITSTSSVLYTLFNTVWFPAMSVPSYWVSGHIECAIQTNQVCSFDKFASNKLPT